MVRENRGGDEPGALITGHLGDAAADANLVMRRAPKTPNSKLSFEASEFAKDNGVFEPFHKACYKSFWEEGVDLGDISVLQGIGRQVGLDPDEMKNRLDTGHYTEQAENQYREALAIGVRGIPSFIMGRYFFSGAQPYDFFRQVAERIQREAREGL